MDIITAVILGTLQGLTEFLPISSSGHLVIAQHLFGLGEVPLLFDVLLHVATLLVVVGAFWGRILEILAALLRLLRGSRTDADRALGRLALVLLVGTAVTAVLGLLVKDLPFFGHPRFAAAMLLVTALLLVSTALAPTREGRNLHHIRLTDGLVVGLVQGLAVLPGISRSGSTIGAALHLGISRRDAGEFSFLLSVPAILGALVLELADAGELASQVPLPSLLAGMAAALLSGYLALKALLRVVKAGRLPLFAFYLVPAGLVGLILL